MKNPDGTGKDSIHRRFDQNTFYTFASLNPNTNYKVSVTATDLADNSNTKEVATTTTPAKPSGLNFSNTTYINTTLSWTASAGATGYDVYLFYNFATIIWG